MVLPLCLLHCSGPDPSNGDSAAPTDQNGLVAVAYQSSNKYNQIFVASQDGATRARITNDSGNDVFPSWSPDGTKIVYLSESPEQGTRQLRVLDADGGNNRALTDPNPNSMLPAHWSRDGQYIAYAASYGSKPDPSLPPHIWVMNADGSEKMQLTDGANVDYFPSWSDDDSFIAFTSNREGGQFQIWRMNRDGSDPARLTTASYDDAIGAPIEQKVPAWSPDGKHIAYWQGVEMDYLSKGMQSGGPPSSRDLAIMNTWHVWLMNADGTNQHELTPGDDPSWSPDGTMVMHQVFESNYQSVNGIEPAGLDATNVDGTNLHTLFTVPKPGPEGSSWQPVR